MKKGFTSTPEQKKLFGLARREENSGKSNLDTGNGNLNIAFDKNKRRSFIRCRGFTPTPNGEPVFNRNAEKGDSINFIIKGVEKAIPSKPGKTIFSNRCRGFTVIELILVLGIIVVLSVVSFINLSGRKGTTQLNGIVSQMGSLLREMQSKSVSQVNGSTWGVTFDNTTTSMGFYGAFKGSTYTSTSSVSYYRLPTNIIYATATLPAGSKKDIYFSQIGGLASATATIDIILQSQNNSSSTIIINSSGAITY